MNKPLYTLRVSLLEDKKTFRDIEITPSKCFQDLCNIIADSYGMSRDGDGSFYNAGPQEYQQCDDLSGLETIAANVTDAQIKSIYTTRIGDVLHSRRQSMMFVYEGDDLVYEFIIELTAISTTRSGVKYPRVTKTVGRNPDAYRSPSVLPYASALGRYEEEGELTPYDLPEPGDVENWDDEGKEKLEFIRKFAELAKDARHMSNAEFARHQAEFKKEMEAALANIELLELESEARVQPGTKDQKIVADYLENDSLPDAQILEIWVKANCSDSPDDIALVRKYKRTGSPKLIALLQFGLDSFPESGLLLQNWSDILTYNKERDKNEFIHHIVSCCNATSNKDDVESLLDMVLSHYPEGLPENIYSLLETACKTDKKKHKLFKKMTAITLDA